MADFDRFQPFLVGFGPAGGLLDRGKSNGPRADGAVKYRMGPWAGPRAPVMPWGIEWAPGPGPGPPPGDGHRHRKTVTGKSYLKTFGMVRGSFWPKLVKSKGFRPNGRYEQLRSTFFIGKSSGPQKLLPRSGS